MIILHTDATYVRNIQFFFFYFTYLTFIIPKANSEIGHSSEDGYQGLYRVAVYYRTILFKVF